MKIITNNHWNFFKIFDDLTKEQKLFAQEMFSFKLIGDGNGAEIPDENEFYDNWIEYKGTLFHISEFMYVADPRPFPDWDGYLSQTYDSGIVIKQNPQNHEQYKIGRHFQ